MARCKAERSKQSLQRNLSLDPRVRFSLTAKYFSAEAIKRSDESNRAKDQKRNRNNCDVKYLIHFYKSQFFKKWANPGLFLFIFVLFKHKLYKKTVGFSGIQTRIVRVEGEHADHLTTTAAHKSQILQEKIAIDSKIYRFNNRKYDVSINKLFLFSFKGKTSFL